VSQRYAWSICIICILLKNVLNYKRYYRLDIHKDSIFACIVGKILKQSNNLVLRPKRLKSSKDSLKVTLSVGWQWKVLGFPGCQFGGFLRLI